MTTIPAKYRKAKASQNGGNCVEVAIEVENPVAAVRDSKNPAAVLAFPLGAVAALVRSVR